MKLSALVDDFSGSVINAAVWNPGTAVLDTTHDFVSVSVGTSSGVTNTFASRSTYDASGSSVAAQVGVAPKGNGGTQTVFRLALDASNYAQLVVGASGVFQFTVTTAGVPATTTLPTYSGHTHRWWRLRESGGTFYGETSPEGLTWSTLASAAHSWSATALGFSFSTSVSDTEPAGMVATLANVNARTGGGNQNFPRMEHGWGARWTTNGGDVPLDGYVDVTARTQGTFSGQRGTQYELDTVQAGTLSGTLTNADGALDPTNTSGPFYGRVLPYQPYRLRAQWPPTRNILSQQLAECTGLPLGPADEGNGGPDMFGFVRPSVVVSSTAFAGTQVWQSDIPSGTTAGGGHDPFYTLQPATLPGRTYTFSARMRNITASTSVQVKPYIVWLNPNPSGANFGLTFGATVTLAGSPTAGWTTLTVTTTAPSNAGGMICGVTVAATTTAALSVQGSGWQYEVGSVATPYCTPGVWSAIHSGYVERWPQTWTSDGTLGVVAPQSVDAFALLSQRVLDDPLTSEISARNPRFLFRFNDPQGSQQAADATGNYSPAQVSVAKLGPGSLTFGNQITATDPVNGVFAGSDTVMSIANASPGTALYDKATFVSLSSSGIHGPAGKMSADFTRIVAFRYTGPVPTTGYATIWSSSPPTKSSASAFGWIVAPDQKPYLLYAGPATTGGPVPVNPPGTTVCDGNWHFLVCTYTAATRGLSVGMDGTMGGTLTMAAADLPIDLYGDSIGAWVDVNIGNAASWNYQGDIAFAAEFPAVLSGDDLSTLYSAWKSQFSGETSSDRYSRILRYAGFIGPKTIESAPMTTSMGPAAISGQDALSALNDVVTTEGGQHFVSAAGWVTFQGRQARYNALTPTYVFGDGPGEYPYEEIGFDYDPTHLGNAVAVTQAATGQVFTADDATSQQNYFPRTLSRTVNADDPYEVQAAAQYLLSRYKDPQTRVETLRLSPASNPALWSVCLALEIGMRIRVSRRPVGRPAITVDMFVQSLNWQIDGNGAASLVIQASPVDSTPYGSFAAWHTQLSAGSAIGATTLTLKAGADNVNPLAAQLAQGQQLTLEPGSANAETVTVKSVGASVSGWTTATVTLNAATTKAHSANVTVCEVLPAGVTDPTKWDGVSAFDQVAFIY